MSLGEVQKGDICIPLSLVKMQHCTYKSLSTKLSFREELVFSTLYNTLFFAKSDDITCVGFGTEAKLSGERERER